MGDEVGADWRARQRLEPAAWLALVLLTGVWAWWAWQEGAFFGTVLLPGTIVLSTGAALLLWVTPARERIAASGPLIVALVALAAIACWAAISALWGPAPDVALVDAQRTGAYAVAFGLGVALCRLLGPRPQLSLVPLAGAAAIAGAITVVSLATGGTPRDLLDSDGTLEFPLGYRNAVAAFFAIALFPALGLAADRDLDWRLRGVALATATLCIDLLLLAQSRASIPAMLVALLVYALASPYRARSLSWLGLAIIPALAIFPPLTALYSAAGDGLADTVDEMHRAGAIAAVTVGAALVLGALAARFEQRLPGLGSDSAASNRRIALGLIAAGVVAAGAFVAAVGDPIGWAGDRLDELRTTETPDLSDRANRFTLNAASERYDYWRVALDDAGEDPLLGTGAGGYRYSYAQKRRTENYVTDAHSVELELLGELGGVGLGLFLVAIGAAAVGIVRSRRAGPAAAGLSAIALASGAYWLVHASVDWFWPYPGITAPVIALAGSACALGSLRLAGRATRARRGLALAALAILAITAVPPWLSERYVNSAYAGWRTDLERAYDSLDRARQLNPLSDRPLLAEASIAKAAGDRERALAALRDAIDVRPEEWAAHYLLADLQADRDPAAARAEIRIALEQNPREPRVRILAEELGVAPPGGAGK